MVQINKSTVLVRGLIMQHRMLKHLPAYTVNQYTSFASLMFEDLRIKIKDLISLRICAIKAAIKMKVAFHVREQ